jgi:hypothetical protein
MPPAKRVNMDALSVPLYRFSWRNNQRRAGMYGRICRVLWRGTMNSALIEFTDNGSARWYRATRFGNTTEPPTLGGRRRKEPTP